MSVHCAISVFVLAHGLKCAHAFYDCRDRPKWIRRDSWHSCSDGAEAYPVVALIGFIGILGLLCLVARALAIYQDWRDDRAVKQWMPVSNDQPRDPTLQSHPSCAPKPPLSLTVTVFSRHLTPKFDVDFRHILRSNKGYSRGGLAYLPPLGSYRYAVAVLGKYPDGDEWLGCRGAPGEWPMAYHGTSIKNVNPIIREGFKLDKCRRATFGKGIYCSPKPEVAKWYSAAYEAYNATATTPGSFYKAVLQVRVDPAKNQVFHTKHKDEYWLITDETAIRPYGICVFQTASV